MLSKNPIHRYFHVSHLASNTIDQTYLYCISKAQTLYLSFHSDHVSTDHVSNSDHSCSKLLVLSTLTEIFSLSFLLYGILHSQLLTNGLLPISLSRIHTTPLRSNNSILLSLCMYSHSLLL